MNLVRCYGISCFKLSMFLWYLLCLIGTDSKAYKRQRSQPSASDTKDLPLKKQLSQQLSVTEKAKEKEKEVCCLSNEMDILCYKTF